MEGLKLVGASTRLEAQGLGGQEMSENDGFQGEGLGPPGRDLERGKPLFRRKSGKVRNLDDSGHKGLADLTCGPPGPSVRNDSFPQVWTAQH